MRQDLPVVPESKPTLLCRLFGHKKEADYFHNNEPAGWHCKRCSCRWGVNPWEVQKTEEPNPLLGIWLTPKEPQIQEQFKTTPDGRAYELNKKGETTVIKKWVACMYVKPSGRDDKYLKCQVFNLELLPKRRLTYVTATYDSYSLRNYEPVADPALIKKLDCLVLKDADNKAKAKAQLKAELFEASMSQSCKENQ